MFVVVTRDLKLQVSPKTCSTSTADAVPSEMRPFRSSPIRLVVLQQTATMRYRPGNAARQTSGDDRPDEFATFSKIG